MTTDQLKQFLGNHKWSLIIGAAMLAMVGFGYQLSHIEERFNIQNLRAAENTLALVSDENSALITKVNQLEVALSVTTMEKEALLEQITELKGEMLELEQQNVFYQRVVSPEQSQEGFIVDNVEVEGLENGRYTLRFVLLQQRQNRAVVNGSLAIELVGIQNGEPFSLKTGDAEFLESPVAYRFRYFQAVSLEFVLPEGSDVNQIHLSTVVYQYQRRIGVYEQSYTWSDVILSR